MIRKQPPAIRWHLVLQDALLLAVILMLIGVVVWALQHGLNYLFD